MALSRNTILPYNFFPQHHIYNSFPPVILRCNLSQRNLEDIRKGQDSCAPSDLHESKGKNQNSCDASPEIQDHWPFKNLKYVEYILKERVRLDEIKKMWWEDGGRGNRRKWLDIQAQQNTRATTPDRQGATSHLL